MRKPWLVGLVLACVLALIGAAAGAAAAAERYVALGDSYSSGTGTREYYDTSCKRSRYAFASIVDAERANTDGVLAACSGATTQDVLSSQVGSLTSGTRWVSITVGGNDAGFSRVITECAQPWWSSNCGASIDRAQSFIRTTLPGRLEQVYAEIRRRAPSATVIALSYPRLFMGEDCNAGTFFSPTEMTRLNETADLLRDTIRGRAAAAGAGFAFRDAIPPFVGHAVCSSSAWVNGLSNPISESYHPNRTGHRSGYVPLVRSVMG
jgi:lysophospholipase L1-like esterase